jgi:hypothetical protein
LAHIVGSNFARKQCFCPRKLPRSVQQRIGGILGNRHAMRLASAALGSVKQV